MTPSANDLYHAALDLAKMGQPVFPCRARHKSKKKKAKAPLTYNGVYDATTDPSQIKAWWREHRDAAIGIPTGILWDVLDVDVKREEDGRVHLNSLRANGLLNGCRFVVKTPSGGWHLYFRAAPDGSLTNKARGTLGLDVRARGGYVLAWPSYIWVVEDEGDSYEGAYSHIGETEGGDTSPLMWDLIINSLAPINKDTNRTIALLPSERRSSLAALREWVSIRKPGERNNALHWAVCRCIDSRLDPYELMDAAILSGLGEDEIRLTIGSALKRSGVSEAELSSAGEALFPEA